MLVLAAPAEYSEEIRKSRFVALAEPVGCAEDALDFFARASRADANHNCWAYRIGQVYRFNDDGEPGGSAGRPILSAIEGQGIDQAAVLVIRYFGGIKLGVGGLMRAYGGVAANCLRNAETRRQVNHVLLHVDAPFDAVGVIYPLIDRFGAEKMGDETYAAAGIALTLKLTEEATPTFVEALTDATAGAARCEIVDD